VCVGGMGGIDGVDYSSVLDLVLEELMAEPICSSAVFLCSGLGKTEASLSQLFIVNCHLVH